MDRMSNLNSILDLFAKYLKVDQKFSKTFITFEEIGLSKNPDDLGRTLLSSIEENRSVSPREVSS